VTALFHITPTFFLIYFNLFNFVLFIFLLFGTLVSFVLFFFFHLLLAPGGGITRNTIVGTKHRAAAGDASFLPRTPAKKIKISQQSVHSACV
jgi:hypothetical protein